MEATAKEVERVHKKQKTCTAKTGDALSKLIKVGRGGVGGGRGAPGLCSCSQSSACGHCMCCSAAQNF